MRIFISGGCKNGKSHYAQHLTRAQQTGLLYYVATMRSGDDEDRARIARHRKERESWGFTTIEQPVAIETILRRCDHSGSFLLDSLTALLANEMFSPSGLLDADAAERISVGLTQVIKGIRNLVIVSDYIYGDAIIYHPLTEAYRKALARIDCVVAEMCDVVLELTYASVIVHKGKTIYDTIY